MAKMHGTERRVAFGHGFNTLKLSVRLLTSRLIFTQIGKISSTVERLLRGSWGGTMALCLYWIKKDTDDFNDFIVSLGISVSEDGGV